MTEKQERRSKEVMAEMMALIDEHERWKGTSEIRAMAKSGKALLDSLCQLAARYGVYMVIQPPEEKFSARWYSCGKNWYEILKRVVFHCYDARVTYDDTRFQRLQEEEGFRCDEKFHRWLVSRASSPNFAAFVTLCDFEGFRISWRYENPLARFEPY